MARLVSIIFSVGLRGDVMKVDISSILKVDDASLNVEFNGSIENFESTYDDLFFGEPIEFKGTFVNIGGIIKLYGRLITGYSVKCSRFLRAIKKDIVVDIKEDFTEEDKFDKDEAYTYQGKIIELDKVLKDNIILNLPAKQICTEECKGLCSICGGNLNEKDCKCSEDEVNPRMAVLKNFFND